MTLSLWICQFVTNTYTYNHWAVSKTNTAQATSKTMSAVSPPTRGPLLSSLSHWALGEREREKEKVWWKTMDEKKRQDTDEREMSHSVVMGPSNRHACPAGLVFHARRWWSTQRWPLRSSHAPRATTPRKPNPNSAEHHHCPLVFCIFRPFECPNKASDYLSFVYTISCLVVTVMGINSECRKQCIKMTFPLELHNQ